MSVINRRTTVCRDPVSQYSSLITPSILSAVPEQKQQYPWVLQIFFFVKRDIFVPK
jgi:hypothetical protein